MAESSPPPTLVSPAAEATIGAENSAPPGMGSSPISAGSVAMASSGRRRKARARETI